MQRFGIMLFAFVFSFSAWALKVPDCSTSDFQSWKIYSSSLITVDQNLLTNTHPRLRKLEEGIVRNALITAAYAALYREERERFGENKTSQYLWLPAAAFASFEVGQNIRHGYLTLKNKLKVFNTLNPAVYIDNPLKEIFLLGRIPFTGEQVGINLALGNKAVYEDLYWQHLSTARCGIQTTLRVLEDYLETYLSVEERTRMTLLEKAWRGIARGLEKDDTDLYLAGNLDLTMVEQKHTLQPLIYNGALGQIAGVIFGKLAVSPVRDEDLESRTFVEYCRDNFLVPNFSNFKVRWGWMTEQLEGMYEFFNGPYSNQVREKHLFFLKDSKHLLEENSQPIAFVL